VALPLLLLSRLAERAPQRVHDALALLGLADRERNHRTALGRPAAAGGDRAPLINDPAILPGRRADR
jgi:hypothetical protein